MIFLSTGICVKREVEGFMTDISRLETILACKASLNSIVNIFCYLCG